MHTADVGGVVVVYTHRFKPEHFSEGVALIMDEFPNAMIEVNQRRQNLFIKHPSTHELINVSFFDDEGSVAEWQESAARQAVLEKLRPMMDGVVDARIGEVAGVVGTDD